MSRLPALCALERTYKVDRPRSSCSQSESIKDAEFVKSENTPRGEIEAASRRLRDWYAAEAERQGEED